MRRVSAVSVSTACSEVGLVSTWEVGLPQTPNSSQVHQVKVAFSDLIPHCRMWQAKLELARMGTTQPVTLGPFSPP